MFYGCHDELMEHWRICVSQALADMLLIQALEEKFEVTNGVIIIRKSKDRQYNGQKEKEKQRFTKHYTAN